MESRRVFWKQRNTIRWVHLGDENTSFFHNIATISHKKNFITCLSSGDTSFFYHDQKAQILWDSFKGRMGISDFKGILYDLSSLINALPMDHLDLDSDFSQEEITVIIKGLPNSHAPGPDGFNGLFIKTCWDIIKGDFFRLFRDFCSSSLDLRSINSSHIALIPKKSNPESVDDYRPISLLNYSLKCITKILSIRLQSVILQLVHANQYGFIKGRTIQDCLA